MRTATLRMFLSLVMCGCAATAAAAVRVHFVEPENFTDARTFNESGDVALAEISQYLVSMGDRYLQPTQTLMVEILDIDLAGKPGFVGSRWENVRVLDGEADWPKLRVRYVLQDRGRAISSGEETIADMNYLWPGKSHSSLEPFSHEKLMLESWFHRRFSGSESSRR